jgi:hypothetical protein
LLLVIVFERDPISGSNQQFQGFHELVSRQQEAVHQERDELQSSLFFVVTHRAAARRSLFRFVIRQAIPH